jgi:hypothetical protein
VVRYGALQHESQQIICFSIFVDFSS